MKVILTGGTGFVGGEVLKQILVDSNITQVTCLLRRKIDIESSKLKVIILDDFSKYSSALSKELASNDACIWALGGKASDQKNLTVYERITYTFITEFTSAITANLKQSFRLWEPLRICFSNLISA